MEEWLRRYIYENEVEGRREKNGKMKGEMVGRCWKRSSGDGGEKLPAEGSKGAEWVYLITGARAHRVP